MKSACIVDGCDRLAFYSSGLCVMHYKRQRRLGSTDLPKRAPEKDCTIDGCTRKQVARGFCPLHYSHVYKDGSLQLVRFVRPHTDSTKGHGEIPGYYWVTVLAGARHRNLPVTVTPEDIWACYQKQKGQCALSGVPIGFAKGRQRKDQTASLDRIDSSKGYEPGNIQWIHKRLQFMKSDSSQEEFLHWCSTIHQYQAL